MLPSIFQIETEPEDPVIPGNKEKLFRYIERCNGEGMGIEGILNLINDREMGIIAFQDLQAERRIITKVVNNGIVWVATGHESTDRT